MHAHTIGDAFAVTANGRCRVIRCGMARVLQASAVSVTARCFACERRHFTCFPVTAVDNRVQGLAAAGVAQLPMTSVSAQGRILGWSVVADPPAHVTSWSANPYLSRQSRTTQPRSQRLLVQQRIKRRARFQATSSVARNPGRPVLLLPPVTRGGVATRRRRACSRYAMGRGSSMTRSVRCSDEGRVL